MLRSISLFLLALLVLLTIVMVTYDKVMLRNDNAVNEFDSPKSAVSYSLLANSSKSPSHISLLSGDKIVIDEFYISSTQISLTPCPKTAAKWSFFAQAVAGHAIPKDISEVPYPIVINMLDSELKHIAKQQLAAHEYCHIKFLVGPNLGVEPVRIADSVDEPDMSDSSLTLKARLYDKQNQLKKELNINTAFSFTHNYQVGQATTYASDIHVVFSWSLPAVFNQVDFNTGNEKTLTRSMLRAVIENQQVSVL